MSLKDIAWKQTILPTKFVHQVTTGFHSWKWFTTRTACQLEMNRKSCDGMAIRHEKSSCQLALLVRKKCSALTQQKILAARQQSHPLPSCRSPRTMCFCTGCPCVRHPWPEVGLQSYLFLSTFLSSSPHIPINAPLWSINRANHVFGCREPRGNSYGHVENMKTSQRQRQRSWLNLSRWSYKAVALPALPLCKLMVQVSL